MMKSLKLALSQWLCPQVHTDAARYRRLWLDLDEARWWLGVKHPEAASMAQWALDQDHYHWTSQFPDKLLPWQPPKWISDINSYRRWLQGKPFGDVA